MAGEYDVARRCLGEAMAAAERDAAMSPETMSTALLSTLLKQMLASRARADVQSLVDYQLEACGTDEHVITRGC